MKSAPVSRIVALALALTAGVPALAQEVAAAKESNTWIAVVFAIVLVIGVAVGSFTSSRRGHQD